MQKAALGVSGGREECTARGMVSASHCQDAA